MHKLPKITIGLPVFNGEHLLREAIDSILSQTFSDFELIIADNASDDSTQKICQEYIKNDKRIQYYRHDENKGWIFNWKFVVRQAKCEYFVYHAADDIWENTFLEKNITILESKKNFIASFCKLDSFGLGYEHFKSHETDSTLSKYYKKTRRNLRELSVYSITGNFEEKIKFCFHKGIFGLCLYGVFKTNILKKTIDNEGTPWDWIVVLDSLRYGDINIIDEILYHRYAGGTSVTNAILRFKQGKYSLNYLFFPRIPFTKWCYEHLGKKIFFQNLDYFIKLNCSGPIIIFLSLIQLINKKIYPEKHKKNLS